MNHSSFRQHAGTWKILKKYKLPTSLIQASSGSRQLQAFLSRPCPVFMLNHIEAQCLQFMFCQEIWVAWSYKSLVPVSARCQDPQGTVGRWMMKVADVDLILPECTTFKGFEVYSIQEGDPQVVLSLNVWTTWTAERRSQQREDERSREQVCHSYPRWWCNIGNESAWKSPSLICYPSTMFNWTPIRRMSINDKNTGFWVRRFSTCKEFMPASSMIFVVLVAYFESTCWKDVSLRVSTHRRSSVPLSLSIFYDIWCSVPEGCSKETKCMCTCCPWCFCRVLPSDNPFVTGSST